jgi:hypothetical protein
MVLNEKKEKYHTVGTVTKYNRKIVERGKIETSTYVHDRGDNSLNICT